MRPELLRISLPDWFPIHELPIRGYGAMLALGFLAAILVAAWRARRENENPDHIYNLAIIALLGGVIGARLFDVIEYADPLYPQWWRGFNLFEGIAWWWVVVGGAVGAGGTLLGLLPWARRAGHVRGKAVIAWTVVAAIGFGRGAYIWANASEYTGFISALKVTSGGLTVYGGLVLALALVAPYLVYLKWRHGVNPLKLADITAPSLALGLAFGRMGCFLNGCCYGGICDYLPWKMHWPEGSLPYNAYIKRGYETMPPLHPAQVYGIINALLLFALLHVGYKHKRRHGMVLGAFFGLYAVSRFLLEALRSDEAKVYMGGLSVSQAVGVFAAAGAIVYLVSLRWLKTSNLDWQPAETRPSATQSNPGKSTRAERRRQKKKDKRG